MRKYKKTFIIDTNVILHDPNAANILSQNNSNLLIFPIVVLEELDKFKSGTTSINYNARVFIRKLENNEFDYEVDINSHTFPNEISLETSRSQDNKILACAYKHKGPNVFFVTKDVNLRMKAKAIKLAAQDYKSDKVEYIPYNGYSIISVEEELFNKIVSETKISYEEFGNTITTNSNTAKPAVKSAKSKRTTKKISKPKDLLNLVPNQYLLLKNIKDDKQRCLAFYSAAEGNIKIIESSSATGVSPKNLEQTFALDALLNPNIPLVALTGISGSGKTLLSLAAAIQNKKLYHQIYITRQTIPVGNDIGFLPGTMKEKLDPYLEPFYDNLKLLKTINGNSEKIQELLDKQKIEPIAITHSRGRSIPKVMLLVDEAQNSGMHELKTLVTRAGVGTKVVLLGDLGQIDTPYLDKNSNGLTHVINKFKGNKLFAYINLTKGERSELAETASNIL